MSTGKTDKVYTNTLTVDKQACFNQNVKIEQDLVLKGDLLVDGEIKNIQCKEVLTNAIHGGVKSVGDTWPFTGRDLTNRSCTEDSNIRASNVTTLVKKFDAAISSGVGAQVRADTWIGSVSVDATQVYVATHNQRDAAGNLLDGRGYLMAFDRVTGVRNWLLDVTTLSGEDAGSFFRGTPAIHGNNLYLGSGNNSPQSYASTPFQTITNPRKFGFPNPGRGTRESFYAIDKATGAEVWKTDLGKVATNAADPDNYVFISQSAIVFEMPYPNANSPTIPIVAIGTSSGNSFIPFFTRTDETDAKGYTRGRFVNGFGTDPNTRITDVGAVYMLNATTGALLTETRMGPTPYAAGDLLSEESIVYGEGESVEVGDYQIWHIVQPTDLATTSTGLGGSPLATGTIGSSVITVTHAAHGMEVTDAGQQVALTGATGFDGILASDLNKLHIVTNVIDAGSYQINVEPAVATAGSVSGGGGGVTADIYGELNLIHPRYSKSKLIISLLPGADIIATSPLVGLPVQDKDGQMVVLAAGAVTGNLEFVTVSMEVVFVAGSNTFYRLEPIPGAAAFDTTTSDLEGAAVFTHTAQAGSTATTFNMVATASDIGNMYNGMTITTTGGTGTGQTRAITGYDGATQIATIGVAWGVIPDGTTTYTIGAGNVPARIVKVLKKGDVLTSQDAYESSYYGASVWGSTLSVNCNKDGVPTEMYATSGQSHKIPYDEVRRFEVNNPPGNFARPLERLWNIRQKQEAFKASNTQSNLDGIRKSNDDRLKDLQTGRALPISDRGRNMHNNSVVSIDLRLGNLGNILWSNKSTDYDTWQLALANDSQRFVSSDLTNLSAAGFQSGFTDVEAHFGFIRGHDGDYGEGCYFCPNLGVCGEDYIVAPNKGGLVTVMKLTNLNDGPTSYEETDFRVICNPGLLGGSNYGSCVNGSKLYTVQANDAHSLTSARVFGKRVFPPIMDWYPLNSTDPNTIVPFITRQSFLSCYDMLTKKVDWEVALLGTNAGNPFATVTNLSCAGDLIFVQPNDLNLQIRSMVDGSLVHSILFDAAGNGHALVMKNEFFMCNGRQGFLADDAGNTNYKSAEFLTCYKLP